MEGRCHIMAGKMSVLQRFTCPLRNLCPSTIRNFAYGRHITSGITQGRSVSKSVGPVGRSQATAVQSEQQTAQPPASQAAYATSAPLTRNLDAPTFQEAIIRLQNYWADFGCAICQPHNTEA